MGCGVYRKSKSTPALLASKRSPRHFVDEAWKAGSVEGWWRGQILVNVKVAKSDEV